MQLWQCLEYQEEERFQLWLITNGHLCMCHMQCLSTLLATPPQPTGHCHMARAAQGMDGPWKHTTLPVNSTQGLGDQW